MGFNGIEWDFMGFFMGFVQLISDRSKMIGGMGGVSLSKVSGDLL